MTAIENIEHHIKYFKKELAIAEKENNIYEEVNRLRQISLAELCIYYIKEEAEPPCEQCAGMQDKAKDIISELLEYHCFDIKDFFPKEANETEAH